MDQTLKVYPNEFIHVSNSLVFPHQNIVTGESSRTLIILSTTLETPNLQTNTETTIKVDRRSSPSCLTAESLQVLILMKEIENAPRISHFIVVVMSGRL